MSACITLFLLFYYVQQTIQKNSMIILTISMLKKQKTKNNCITHFLYFLYAATSITITKTITDFFTK